MRNLIKIKIKIKIKIILFPDQHQCALSYLVGVKLNLSFSQTTKNS